jgi:hypothetical protein
MLLTDAGALKTMSIYWSNKVSGPDFGRILISFKIRSFPAGRWPAGGQILKAD